MATSDILQFAGAGGANVLTQVEYAALTSVLAGGYSSGILDSNLLNKTLRQSSFMSAGLAAFMVNQGISVPDDGNLSALALNIATAINQLIAAGQQSVVITSATFEGTVANGNAVYYDSVNGWFAKAQAAGGTSQNLVGIADVTHTKVIIYGDCITVTGLTPGAKYYLSAATPGALTAVVPTTNVVIAGIAKSATELWVNVDFQQDAVTLTGAVFPFTANVAPSGFLVADGSLVARASYPALWAYAQASGNIAATDGAWVDGQYSPGNGSTTFRIPDLRGDFLRGWDDARGIDTGRAIGTLQTDAFAAHTHNITGSQQTNNSGTSTTYSNFIGTGTTATSSTGGTETRPRNAALLFCIKY